jgi:hypothetical protein
LREKGETGREKQKGFFFIEKERNKEKREV